MGITTEQHAEILNWACCSRTVSIWDGHELGCFVFVFHVLCATSFFHTRKQLTLLIMEMIPFR